MSKKSQIDLVIERLDGEIAVLRAARERLVHQREQSPARQKKLPGAVLKDAE